MPCYGNAPGAIVRAGAAVASVARRGRCITWLKRMCRRAVPSRGAPRCEGLVVPFAPQAVVAGAIICRWSFRRLWVAVISRHSERAADLPRRKKRSIRRLNFVSAKTGSIIALRFR